MDEFDVEYEWDEEMGDFHRQSPRYANEVYCPRAHELMRGGGGVSIICEHGRTQEHATADEAWAEWERQHQRGE